MVKYALCCLGMMVDFCGCQKNWAFPQGKFKAKSVGWIMDNGNGDRDFCL